MLLQHCKQIILFVPTEKNLQAGTFTQRTTQHTWYYWRNPTGKHLVFCTPRSGMAPFGISSGTVSLSGLLQQKAPSGSQCLQFSENPGQENRNYWIPVQLISQSLFTTQPLIIASKLRYSTSGFNKTWLPRKWWEKGRSMQSSLSYQHQLLWKLWDMLFRQIQLSMITQPLFLG